MEELTRAGLRRPQLPQLIRAEIERLIASNRVRPGSRLPSEREFARALGVSRTSVREAIRTLQAEGVIEVRSGVGAFLVHDPGEGPRATCNACQDPKPE